MALFAIAALFTTPCPESFTQHDANKTVLLHVDNVSGAALGGDTNSTSSIAYLRYVPVDLRDTGAAAVFVATILAIGAGGGYTGSIITRVEMEIRNTSTDTADYNARMSKCDRRDLELLAGPCDRCLCVLYMIVTCIALAIAATLSLLDEWKSPRISIARETAIDFMVRVRGAGAIDTGTVVFGAEDTDAAYTFKAWVCGWENSSLLVGNKPGHADFHTACQRQVSFAFSWPSIQSPCRFCFWRWTHLLILVPHIEGIRISASRCIWVGLCADDNCHTTILDQQSH